MRAFTVVNLQPPLRDRPYLRQRFKGIRIEHFRPVGPIEAPDVRVLIGLARLDVMQGNAMRRAPIDEDLRQKFGAVVRAPCVGQAMQHYQHAHQARTGDRCADL